MPKQNLPPQNEELHSTLIVTLTFLRTKVRSPGDSSSSGVGGSGLLGAPPLPEVDTADAPGLDTAPPDVPSGVELKPAL